MSPHLHYFCWFHRKTNWLLHCLRGNMCNRLLLQMSKLKFMTEANWNVNVYERCTTSVSFAIRVAKTRAGQSSELKDRKLNHWWHLQSSRVTHQHLWSRRQRHPPPNSCHKNYPPPVVQLCKRQYPQPRNTNTTVVQKTPNEKTRRISVQNVSNHQAAERLWKIRSKREAEM